MSLARRLIFASAAYDLAVTAPFATPWSARWIFEKLGAVHTQLGLAGATPPTDPATVLFASLMGFAVVMWSVARLRAPTAFHGALDTGGRAAFSISFVVALRHGASGLLWPMLVAELAWFVVQGLAVMSLVRLSGATEPARAHR